ncbi:MAG: PQQ-like beta-propeller repeat protein [Spirochaetes bacterium]|nr:PQQ-like beta-propeller repeat protein [Spirochaetota bacterium]
MKTIFILLGVSIMSLTISAEVSAEVELNGPEGVAFWSEQNCYYVTDAKEGLVYRIDKDKRLTVFSDAYKGEILMMPLVLKDKLYVTANLKGNDVLSGHLLCWSLLDGSLLFSKKIGGINGLAGIAADTDGKKIFMLCQQGGLFSYDIASGTLDTLHAVLAGNGLCYQESDNSLIIVAWGKKMQKFYIDTYKIELLAQTKAANYTNIARYKDYFVLSLWNNSIFLVNSQFTERTAITTMPLRNPVGLCVNESANEFIICNYADGKQGSLQVYNLQKILACYAVADTMLGKSLPGYIR